MTRTGGCLLEISCSRFIEEFLNRGLVLRAIGKTKIATTL